MRRSPTEPEKRLWRRLSKSQVGGLKFRRQHVVCEAQAIVDFRCPAMGLAVEIDGDTHDPSEDAKRDAQLAHLGFTTFRVSNVDVMQNIDGVLEAILAKALSLPPRWSSRTAPPQPLP